MDDVADRVRAFIRNELGWDGPDELLADDSSLIDTGVLDSLGLLEVAAFLEASYHIQVDEVDLVADNFETPSRIAGYVRRKHTARVT